MISSRWKLQAAAALSSLALVLTTTVLAATNVDIKFENHLQAGFPEQDVFLVSKDDSSKVVRVEPNDVKDSAVLEKEAFSSATMTAHDPFKLGQTPLGPFAKGKDLGFTLKQWLDATGTGTYSVDGDKASLDLTFSKLVPNGLYTIWCSRLTLPPNVKVVDKPCGAEDGSENSFRSDAAGDGKFTLSSFTPLEETTKETASVIALAFHSDGKTYGADPGEFGSKTHVQVFFLVPAKAEAAETAVPTAVPQAAGGLSKNAWLAILAGIVVIGLGWWWFSKKESSSTPTHQE